MRNNRIILIEFEVGRTASEVEHVTFIELIAPAGEGKSAIMDATTQVNPEYSLATSFTTRNREARDIPGAYRYFTTDEEITGLLDRIDDQAVLQYVVHPTTHKLYGSMSEDYRTNFVMLDTLFNNVDELDKLPFKAIYKIAVVSHGDEWAARFLDRYPTASEERTKRIGEAILCLEWILAQDPNVLFWLQNRPNQVTDAAHDLILMTKTAMPSQNLRVLAEEMHAEAEKIAA